MALLDPARLFEKMGEAHLVCGTVPGGLVGCVCILSSGICPSNNPQGKFCAMNGVLKRIKKVVIVCWVLLATYVVSVATLAFVLGRTPEWIVSFWTVRWLANSIMWFYTSLLIASAGWAICRVYQSGMRKAGRSG